MDPYATTRHAEWVMVPGGAPAGRGLYPRGVVWRPQPRLQIGTARQPRGHPLRALARLTTIPLSPRKMAKTTLPTAQTAAPPSYEDALAELERLVAAMEAGQLPLDQLLETYRRGAELLAFCRSRLDAVEQQVKVLEDGQLKPWVAA